VLYTEHIQKALDFMEAHLTQECTLECCARAAGYSPYHFSRIFKDMTGLSPIDYVRKRRLTQAAGDIAESTLPIIDIAIEWGFESTETFIRAFEAEHGITPGKYRGSGMSLHLTKPFSTPTGVFPAMPEPEIVTLPERTHCGYPFWVEPGAKHGTIPRFWNYYHAHGLAQSLPINAGDGWYDDVGCSILAPTGGQTYIIGIWTDKAGPEGTVLTLVPAGLYAVFSTPPADAYTFVETIHKTWDAIYGLWLPASGYCRAPGLQVECYCENSHTFTEKIHIPIMIKE
jgi:AraC family transcriptional regulator